MTKNWIVAGISGLLLASVLAAGALARGTGTGTRGRAHPQHARPLLRALGLTRAQKEQALAVAREAQPLVRELRARIRAERGQGREHVRDLVRETFQELRPQVRGLLDTLTPEQRERVTALARRHGRTLDEGRLERRLAFLLSRPGAAARIQRNLER